MNDAETPGAPGRKRDGRFLERALGDMVRGSLWTAIATVVGMPVAFLASLVVARELGAADFGQFSALVAGYAALNAALNGGWSEATVQWLAGAFARDDQSALRRLVGQSVGYNVLVSGPLLAIFAFVFASPAGCLPAALAAVAVMFTHVVGTASVITTAGARNAPQAQFALGAGLALQAGLIITAVGGASSNGVWVAHLVGLTIGPGLCIAILSRPERRALASPRLPRGLPSGFGVYALSASAASLTKLLVHGRSEIFVLLAVGQKSAAGVYAVVTGLASQMTAPLDALLGPLHPVAAALFAVDEPRATRAFDRALRITALLAAVGAVAILPAVVVLLGFMFGSEFEEGRAALVALGLVSCLGTVSGPIVALAFATRVAPQILAVSLVALAVDVLLSLTLIPPFGLSGAVVAASCAQVTNLLLVADVVARRLAIKRTRIAGNCALFWGPGALVGLTLALTAIRLELDGPLYAVLSAAAGLGALMTIMWTVPRFRVRDDDLQAAVRDGGPKVLRRLAELLRRLRLVQAARPVS